MTRDEFQALEGLPKPIVEEPRLYVLHDRVFFPESVWEKVSWALSHYTYWPARLPETVTSWGYYDGKQAVRLITYQAKVGGFYEFPLICFPDALQIEALHSRHVSLRLGEQTWEYKNYGEGAPSDNRAAYFAAGAIMSLKL